MLLCFFTEPNAGIDDIDALNYALTLEHLEAAYYNKFVPKLGQASFNNAGLKANYSYFLLIKAHENAHVVYLQEAITSLSGTPVPPWYVSLSLSLSLLYWLTWNK